MEDTSLLHSLHGGQLLKLHSPMLNLNWGELIVGSSMGWLAIVCYKRVFITIGTVVSYTPSLHLLNPISNERIPLPSLQTLTIYNVVLSAAPTSRDCVLVLSICVDDCSVSYAWCRLGDSQWTFFKVPHDPFFCVVDMVFHRGKLYILGDEGKYNVYAFELQPQMTGNGIIPNISESKQQIVHSGGELLFVGQRRSQPKIWDLLKQVEEMGRSRTNPGTLANDNFPPMPSIWLPPPEDTLKVNLDTGFLDGVATYGIVVRNHLGHVVTCKYGRCSAPDPFHAKGLALLHGMELAALLNFSRVMFECDDERLVTVLEYDEAQPPRNTCEIIKSCKKLATAKFDECSFCYIRWEGNTTAHGLTLLAQNDQSPNVDMGVTSLVVPDAISEVISAELANM